MPDPLQPPVPFDDFTFAFDPALHNLFPSPPPLPSSADLFSPSETTNLFGFLENLNWDLEAEAQNVVHTPSPLSNLQSDVQHQPPPPFPQMTRSTSQEGGQSLHDLVAASHHSQRDAATASALVSLSPAEPSPPPQTPAQSASSPTLASQSGNGSAARPKPLLSTPQKRLNHIMSEQKRRNAIRDGYVQLTALLAPAGAPPGAGMPTRGRPKGSGSRNGGRGNGKGGMAFKGKSGILFRAVEYIRWLEEGRDALHEEVMKVEAAAGINHATAAN
ncbi:hypothetical protein NLI96_g12758 [Meripilus lineatus]|uniref:BHLH domain-containing protein n=1 Tax=Meripilus lineatus TaxID=2056292 RepID=A0AAD5Y7X0_9APHY|nr:hypothetical protein NLI96_g12758 [Physisporinus lineatus]